jgi:hypothetical protein
MSLLLGRNKLECLLLGSFKASRLLMSAARNSTLL